MSALGRRARRLLAAVETIAQQAEMPTYVVYPSEAFDRYQAAVEAGLLPSRPAVKVYVGGDWPSLV